MEVSVVTAENIPEGCLLSLSAGGSRRQAPLVPRQKFAFNSQCAAAAAAAGGSGLRVDVLAVRGSTCVASADLLPALQKSQASQDGAANASGHPHRFDVNVTPNDFNSGTIAEVAEALQQMKINLHIKPSSKERKEEPNRDSGNGSETSRTVPPGTVRGESVAAELPAELLKQTSLMEPHSARTGPTDPNPKSNPAQRSSRRHHVALEARSYLEQHSILPFVERLLRTLVQDRPLDPWSAISAMLPDAAFPDPIKKGLLVPVKGIEESESEQPLPSWRFRPSVGTWYFGPKVPVQVSKTPGQAPEAPETSKPPEEPTKEEQLTPEVTQAPKELKLDAPVAQKVSGSSGPVVTSATILALVLSKLDFETLATAPRTCAVLLEEVKQVVANRFGVRSVRVEMGGASPTGIEISATIHNPSSGMAKIVKQAIEDDAAGLLSEVEKQLKAAPELEGISMPDSTSFGAQDLRVTVRQQLVASASFGDSLQQPQMQMTASTALPGTMDVAGFSGGSYHSSFYSQDSIALQTMNKFQMTAAETDVLESALRRPDSAADEAQKKPKIEVQTSDELPEIRKQAKGVFAKAAKQGKLRTPKGQQSMGSCGLEEEQEEEDLQIVSGKYVDDFLPAVALSRSPAHGSSDTTPMVSARATPEVETPSGRGSLAAVLMAVVEFTFVNLDYNGILAKAELCKGIAGKIQEAISKHLGVLTTQVEVSLSAGEKTLVTATVPCKNNAVATTMTKVAETGNLCELVALQTKQLPDLSASLEGPEPVLTGLKTKVEQFLKPRSAFVPLAETPEDQDGNENVSFIPKLLLDPYELEAGPGTSPMQTAEREAEGRPDSTMSMITLSGASEGDVAEMIAGNLVHTGKQDAARPDTVGSLVSAGTVSATSEAALAEQIAGNLVMTGKLEVAQAEEHGPLANVEFSDIAKSGSDVITRQDWESFQAEQIAKASQASGDPVVEATKEAAAAMEEVIAGAITARSHGSEEPGDGSPKRQATLDSVPLMPSFESMDANGDGVITREEYYASMITFKSAGTEPPAAALDVLPPDPRQSSKVDSMISDGSVWPIAPDVPAPQIIQSSDDGISATLVSMGTADIAEAEAQALDTLARNVMEKASEADAEAAKEAEVAQWMQSHLKAQAIASANEGSVVTVGVEEIGDSSAASPRVETSNMDMQPRPSPAAVSFVSIGSAGGPPSALASQVAALSKASFEDLDKNGDGIISQLEYDEFLHAALGAANREEQAVLHEVATQAAAAVLKAGQFPKGVEEEVDELDAGEAEAEKEEPLPEQTPKQEATAEAEASSKVAKTSEVDSIRDKAAAAILAAARDGSLAVYLQQVTPSESSQMAAPPAPAQEEMKPKTTAAEEPSKELPEEDPIEVMRKKAGSAILAASKDGSLAEKLQHGEDALRALRGEVKPSGSSETAAPPPPAQEEMKLEVAAVEEAPKELPKEVPVESIGKKAGIALLAATKDGTLAEKLQQAKAQSTSDAVAASPAEEPKAADAELKYQVTLKDGETEAQEEAKEEAKAEAKESEIQEEAKAEADEEAKEAEIQEEAKKEAKEAEAKKGGEFLQEQKDKESVPKAEEPKPEELKVSSSSPEAEEAHPEDDETMIAEVQEKVSEAIEENHRLRTENEALRVELDKLLAMTITPDDTPPGTAGR